MDDIDRPLSARGQRDAPRMGRWLRNQGYRPERLICSPALRARQTVEYLVQENVSRLDDVIYEPMIYEAGLNDLLAVLHEHGSRVNRLMLVGHNPGLDGLVSYLSDRTPQRTLSGKMMTTAAVAVLRLQHAERQLTQSCAELIEIMRPRMLEDEMDDR